MQITGCALLIIHMMKEKKMILLTLFFSATFVFRASLNGKLSAPIDARKSILRMEVKCSLVHTVATDLSLLAGD